MNIEQEIETLIRARYPLLYLVTSEEGRAQQMLENVAQRRQKRLYEWSCSTGIVPAGVSIQSPKHRSSSSKDPLVALDQVIDRGTCILGLVRMHAHRRKQLDMALSQGQYPRKISEIDAHAQCVGYLIVRHAFEDLRDPAKILLEVDVAMRIDKHHESSVSLCKK